MGALGLAEFVVLAIVIAIPLSIVIGAIVYVVRLARWGPRATLGDARRTGPPLRTSGRPRGEDGEDTA
ncbi:hypothetical protein [Salinactinospora qingdaonensis]|uniref:Uncharacterized protein n=1 Tax=Salinactinospora qingdaonensis TaxID=702744 RepID=A0ABP7FP59_9ACTN